MPLFSLGAIPALLLPLAMAAPQPSDEVMKLDTYVVTAINPVIKIAEHPMVEPRFGAAVVAESDYLYIIGGSNSDGTRLDTVERVDLRTGHAAHWTKLKVARRHHRAVVSDGKIYVLGGTSGPSDPDNPLSEELSDYEGDDRDIGEMLPPNLLAPPPNPLRKPNPGAVRISYSYEATMEVIDLQTGQVSLGPEMPIAKALFGCVLVDGRILVIGGQKRKGDAIFCTNTTEEFDLMTQTWGKGPNMPTPRRCTAALVDGFVVVLGGHRGAHTSAIIEAFNSQTRIWRRLPDLAKPLSPGAVVWAGNYLLLFGGQDFYSRQLVYDLRSKQLVPYPLPLPNSDFAAAVLHRGKIYVVGGANLQLHDTSEAIRVFTPTVEAETPPAEAAPPPK